MNTKLPRLIPPLSSNLLTKTSHLFIQPHKTTRYSTHSLQTLQSSLNTNNPIITNICNSLHKGENWESLTEKFQSLHFTAPKTSHFFIQPHKNSYSTHSLQVLQDSTNTNNPIITSICNSLRKGENWESLTKKFQSFHFTPSIIQEILLHLKEPIDAKNALNFFHWSAKNSNTRHGVFIYCVIIHILAKSKLVRHANALIESALRNETLFVVLDSLIGSYKLVDSCPFVFDLFVQSCAKLRLIDKSLDVCKLLDENGFMLSVISYNTLLHVVQKSEKTCMVWGIYEYMIEKRIYPNEMTTRIMISALCKEGRLQRFLDVVEKSHGKRCQQPGVVVNTCLIYGMIEEGRIEDGLRLMKRMLQKNMILDTISCSLVVLAKVKTRDLESAWGVYDEMVRRGFEGNALVYDSFIGAYCEEERIDEAIKLMGEMECLNTKPFGETFDHLIKSCSEMGRLEESLKFCDKMMAYGFLPSCLSFNKLVAKLCENGNAKYADQLLTKLMDKGFVPDQSMYTYLIAGYANACDVEGALKLYYEIQYRSISPNASIFDSLIIALCQRGRLKEADEFLSLMIGQSLKPGIHVYKKLIASHLERGDETRAHHLYRQRRTEIDNIRCFFLP
ncbi:pentatricopeptide repeat-containing protein At1g66345, mitochondrial [Lycium ferocissimum]|uniref:pentatricopeptide repeat-containing protein At1g66345, mitochondrial n=1 Tax=Lycium ferocissimum TaxID=112874 RepID=UPI00281530C6|nr:pentatricopeptide repeat-containing protein At1g66345, mitochondrial [Lycium ferocissimum]XP_059318085.1 pentatricopeptide repeat-containing protein At1g66345, mitochondrial [Lycium ferocissimum]XP_059318086.1 pentatricopeptide repeat-containing protein At1g66345, mitochondrial [Lycium ferocissimum]XP_059318087.1 pentatricopeptide repeat-containing protein At1g66345, mitochondrial [Lycium ferocissimum]XP_059318088.1 pentatricopeptide repeat-containing protein At1g66345, mitochondrial [Lycium